MSFYRISDPKKRDAIVEEYIATVKRVKERNLKERMGDTYRRQEMERHWQPVVQSNEKMMKAITKDLKPIKTEVEDINRHIKGEEEEEPPRKIRRISDAYEGLLAQQFKNKILSKDPDVDTTYGIRFLLDGRTAMGDKIVTIQNDNIVVSNEVYDGTPGLWALITGVKENQIKDEFTQDDLDEYEKLLKHTNVLYRDFDSNNSNPRANGSWKWSKLLKPIWEDWKNDDDDLSDGNGLFIQKKGKCYQVQTVDGDGLLLTPRLPYKEVGNGLFLKRGSDIYVGEGLLLGENSPFRNIPVLGWIL